MARTSTVGSQNLALAGILELHAALKESQNQLSTGKKIQRVSDNPIAASQILRIDQETKLAERFSASAAAAERSLSLQETMMEQYNSNMIRLRELAIQAGSTGFLSNEDRQSIAAEMEQILEIVRGVSNTRNSQGEYIFSGFKSSSESFSKDVAGRSIYQGDQGERTVQIGPDIRVTTSESGYAVFGDIAATAGSFYTSSQANNLGNGVISMGQVHDIEAVKAQMTQGYTIVFNEASPTANFDVFADTDLTTPLTGFDNVPYTSGEDIVIAGVKFTISGSPLAGDKFSVGKANKQNVFDMTQYYINSLNSSTDNEKIAFATEVFLDNITSAQATANHSQARIGARLALVDVQEQVNAEMNFTNEKILSELRDIDYAKVVSRVSQLSFSLEAAQQTFVRITGLQLFNYM